MNSDFLIVGAGVIGLATAQHLLGLGMSVTVLERGVTAEESSWAGGGILSPLCPWDYPDEVTRLTERGASLFARWAAELRVMTGIDPEYDVSGLLVLPPFDLQTAKNWCATHAVQLLQADASNGGLSGESMGIVLPQVAQVRNPRLMQALRQRVELLGGRIVEHCAVQSLKSAADRVHVALTARGEFSAENFIIAAGAWSTQVLGPHALRLDIKPVRGQMLLYKFPAPPLHHIVVQGDLYLIPRRDGHLLVGSTLEDVGFDKNITPAAYASLYQRAAQILPQLEGMPLAQHWAGLRPASPRNIPTIGRHPHLKNLYLNSGHYRYGVTMAPASVEILMNEITGAAQPFDIVPYQVGWNG
ncbi:MAG: glycine oxidase ThiO [Pseudomonadota bacterium]